MTWPNGFNPEGLGTYRTEVTRARRGVQTQQQPRDGDHVVLHERLGETFGQEAGEKVCSVIHWEMQRGRGALPALWGSHLVEQRVQHADAEDPPGREGQAEHEGQVGAILSLFLQKKEEM